MRKMYILFALMVLLSCSACSRQNEVYYEKSSIVMDTVVTLSASGENAEKAVNESFDRLKELDEMASPTLADSDVVKINAAAGDHAVKVHPEIYRMLEVSQEYSKLTDGAWDATMGPIINLWGIGTDQQKLPMPEEVQAVLKLVGYKDLSLQEDLNVKLERKGMAIDLGGIAKGYAADEVEKIYQKYQIKNGLINLGSSSMYALGENKKGKAWNVGIKHPRNDDASVYLAIVGLKDESLSTSGDYERFFIQDGKRYHHIFDPKTGYPADTGVMNDTIVIDGSVPEGGMLADLLTTAVFVMGPEKGRDFLDGLGFAQGEITTKDHLIYTAGGFKSKMMKLNPDFQFTQ